MNVTLLLAFPSNNFSQEQVPAPVYKDGDFWVFRVTHRDRLGSNTARVEGDYQISYAGGELKMFRVAGDETGGVERVRGELRGMLHMESKNKRYQYLQFPLSVGQKWTRDYEYSGAGARGKYVLRRRTAKQGVAGIEQIATPAGTFRTFKIESEPIGAGEGGEVLGLLYYYGPESKSIVKFLMSRSEQNGADRGKTEIDLIKFGTAP